jgi:hypothetical protein
VQGLAQKKPPHHVDGAAVLAKPGNIDRELGEITAKRFRLERCSTHAKNYFCLHINILVRSSRDPRVPDPPPPAPSTRLLGSPCTRNVRPP